MSLPKLEARAVGKCITATNWGLYNAETGAYITGQLTEQEAKCFVKMQKDNEVLINQIMEFVLFLKQFETYELQMILEDDCWNTPDGLPHLTREIFAKYSKLQDKRNELMYGKRVLGEVQ